MPDSKNFFDELLNEMVDAIEQLLPDSDKSNFDHAEMQPQQIAQELTKDQLKNITSLTGHDHNEEMAEMIMRYLRQLPDGEKIIAKQISEQFPEGWEFEEEQRVIRDSETLKSVIESIANTSTIEDCEKHANTFQTYLEFENKGKGVRKTGKHFNVQMLIEALELYDEYYYRFGGSLDSPKNLLFWQKIIGHIERFLPANYAQAFCAGLGSMVRYGRRLLRSLRLRNYDTNQEINFFPLDTDPSSRLGSHFAVYSYHAKRARACVEGALSSLESTRLQTISSKKQQRCEDLRRSQTYTPRIVVL